MKTCKSCGTELGTEEDNLIYCSLCEKHGIGKNDKGKLGFTSIYDSVLEFYYVQLKNVCPTCKKHLKEVGFTKDVAFKEATCETCSNRKVKEVKANGFP